MNTSPIVVRKPRPATKDPRVERTKRALGSALVELVLERDFDSITVQDVLDRADVGRATFYAHFRNKRDLFLSDYERMLDGMERHIQREPAASRRVAPVAEFFGHIADARSLLDALRASGQFELLWTLAAAQFAKMIERRLVVLTPDVQGARRVLTAKFCAGALVEMLNWWLDRDARPTPAQMDELYHELVWKAPGNRV